MGRGAKGRWKVTVHANRVVESAARKKQPRALHHGRSASVSHPLSLLEDYPLMQVTTGVVVGGKVVVEGVSLVEGSVVAVLSREPGEPFTLSPEDEDELLAAMAEIERGEFVSSDEVLESLRKYG